MNLLDLNEDVLRQICDFLIGKHALNLSRTSKRLYDLAICRATATVYASCLQELQAFHQSVLHSSPPRARYLESFSIDWNVFVGSKPGYDPEALAMPLLIDMFLNAHNLSRLSLDSVHSLFQQHPESDKLLLALSGLRNLKRVRLGKVTDTDLTFIAGTGWDLHALHLEYSWIHEWHSWNTDDQDTATMTYPAILNALGHFPNLHTLRIADFENVNWESFCETLHSTAPVFPSIRRVFIAYGDLLPAHALVDRCPNVELVDISQDQPDAAEILSRPRPLWPALRSLRCEAYALHPAWFTAHFGTVDHLKIREELLFVDVENDSEDKSALLYILQRASPVWAQLMVKVGAEPMHFWAEVAPLAPRLRYLELRVTILSLKEEYLDWLENVPDALSVLPLLYLRLYLPELPERTRVRRAADGKVLYEVTKDVKNAFHAARDVALRTLPARCAHTIPTLKFFVCAHSRPRSNSLGKQRAQAGTREEEMGDEEFDEAKVRESFEAFEPDDYYSTDMWRRMFQWGRPGVRAWRVAREGGDCELQQLTVEQGARLRECLEGIWYGKDPLDDVLDLYKAIAL